MMTTTASIAELQHAGVTLEAGEAVAVAQQLIQTLRRSDDAGAVEPPYGPPTAANVILNADGSVSCAACGTTPAISEIAIFLDALLPPGSAHVPGGLRYAIARGLLEVDVTPFDSLDDFSRTLMRHECGPRDEVVRRLVRRAESARAAAPGRRADRRRSGTTELRRALREADARLYAHQLAAAMPPSRPGRHAEAIAEAGEPRRSWRSILSASGGGPIAPPPIRPRTMPAIAVCLGSGLMLVAAGEFMHHRPPATPAAAPVVAPVAVGPAGTSPITTMAPLVPLSERATVARAGDAPTGARAAQATGGASTSAANSTRPRRVRAMRTESGQSDRTSEGRAARTSEAGVRKARAQRTSPGILDRLRLRWLRDAFSLES